VGWDNVLRKKYFFKKENPMEKNGVKTVTEGSTVKKLLFVYNADTGLFNVITDYAHKIISPKTYPCTLCALTYGNRGMNNKWKDFIGNLKVPINFLHRDEFVKQYASGGTQLPAAFLQQGETTTTLITHDEINKCTTVDELIDLVSKKIKSVDWAKTSYKG
jgi:hypothetical protein